jgi:cytoskeletal protein CcmA (bactofilin family)
VPSTSSGRVVETLSTPKVSANDVSPTSSVAHATSWLGPTLRVKGEISGKEDLLVDGKVEGPISAGEHRLTVGHNGQVTGGLAAREIIVYGAIGIIFWGYNDRRAVLAGAVSIPNERRI